MSQGSIDNKSKRDIEFFVIKKNWEKSFATLDEQLKIKKNDRAIEICDMLIRDVNTIPPPKYSEFYNYELYLTVLDLKSDVKEPIYPSYNFYSSNISGRNAYFLKVKNELENNIYNDSSLSIIKQYYFYHDVSLIFSNDWLFKPSIFFSTAFLSHFENIFDKIEIMRASDTFRMKKFKMPLFIKSNPEESFYIIDETDLKKIKQILESESIILKLNFEPEYNLLSKICSQTEVANGVFVFR